MSPCRTLKYVDDDDDIYYLPLINSLNSSKLVLWLSELYSPLHSPWFDCKLRMNVINIFFIDWSPYSASDDVSAS